MGCVNSLQDNTKDPRKQIKTKDEFKISQSDLVSEKQGKITRDYILLNPPLGKGGFGEVRKAIHKLSNLQMAVKIINKKNTSKDEQQKLKQEVEMLKKLDHPNIIKVYEFYQDSKHFYIVTELCTGGELFDKILESFSFSEKKAAETMKQILSAVSYCHSYNIVHRDLKPENILYESPRPNSLLKIIDFGTSRVYDPGQKMNQKTGTPYYIAPEVLDKKYDQKCDIWSCGVILYILLFGEPPFNGQDDYSIMKAVRFGTYSLERSFISQEAKDLLQKMLDRKPETRISATEALNHPWFTTFIKKPEIDLPQLTQALKNMQAFRAEKKLQEAALLFMVNYLTTKDERNQLLKQFQALDLNNDGRLSREELVIGFQKVLNEAQVEEEVDRIMKSVDKNDSGAIDYSEFVFASINRENLLQKQRLETVFRMFDQDGSGMISSDEIKQIFGSNAQISEDVWKEIVKEVDENGDGQISYQEFKEMMLKVIEK